MDGSSREDAMRRRAGELGLAFFTLMLPGAGHALPQPVVALAPVEILLDGRSELVGVAVDADGTVYVSDRGSGYVYRLAVDGRLAVVASSLDRPAGLTFDLEQRLLVAEEKAGRILRIDAGGSVTTVVAGIGTPRWIAVSPSGALYVSAHRLIAPDGPDPEEGREILLVHPHAGVSVAAAGIRRLEGLLARDDTVIAASMGLEAEADGGGALLRFAVRAGGALGSAQVWLGTGLTQPVGLVDDVLGGVYASSHMLVATADRARRAVGKIHPEVRLSSFAENLEDPRGIALGPDGSLYVADGRSGRLLRFRAPAPPALEPAAPFVTEPSVVIAGTTAPDARLDVATRASRVVAATTADTSGAFAVTVPLAENATSELFVLATPHRGDGLVGAPAAVEITHDDRPPSVTLLEPAAGAFLRQTVTVRAQASDAGVGVGSLAITLGSQTISTVSNPDPSRPVTATASIDTAAHPDGIHTLAASAEDRTGTRAATSRSVVVDNTPPDTQVAVNLDGHSAGGAVSFAFTGTDNLTPATDLTFSWRIDPAAWSPFVAATAATLEKLAPGAHVFEVRARDLAGNEDSTPASRAFTVGGGVQIAIVAPVDGATVPAGSMLVRGVVAPGGPDVAVTVNGVPAAVDVGSFAAIVRTEPGALVLSALATTASGASAQGAVAVTVTDQSQLVSELRVTPARGLAPLAATFTLAGVTGGVVELDADGDGVLDFVGPALDGYVHTYSVPGVYVATATVTDTHGYRSVQHAVLDALDRAAADAFFRARWTAFRDGLSQADVEATLGVVVEGQRDRYRRALQALAPDLATIAGGLSDMTLLSFGEHVVEGVVTRVREGVTHLHFVYFMRDDDGIWKIVEI
jgi:sugar lactone lactonase YvrE